MMTRHTMRQTCTGQRQGGPISTAASLLLVATMTTVVLPESSLLAADHGEPVAHVVRISNACSSSFKVLGQTEIGSAQDEDEPGCSVGFYRAIYDGDQIVISDSNDWLELQFSGGRTIRLEKRNSPFKVQGGRKRPTPIDNLWRSVFDLLGPPTNRRATEALSASAISAASRGPSGGPFEVPLFDGVSPIKLAAGDRRFALEWSGGVPPFRVEVVRDGEVSPIGDWSDLDEQGIDSHTIGLAPGQYQILVRDSANGRKATDLTVVAPADLPSLPGDLQPIDAEEDIAQLVFAAWLTNQDESFRLESYLRARDLATHYLPAQALVERLGYGRPVPLTYP